MKIIKLVVVVNDDLVNYIINHTDYSKSKVKAFLKYKKVAINGEIVKKLPQNVKIDDTITIDLEIKENLPFEIIYEDNDILVVNKPAGLLTMASLHEQGDTLYNLVREYANKHHFFVFIVHRLDRDTSGLVMFAKNERMKMLYQDNWNELVTKRYYMALVEGKITSDGRIQNLLYEEKNTFVHSAKIGKLAITNYKVIKYNDDYTLLDVSIETGRKNQIRVHLSELGHPIVGDRKYGAKTDPLKRMGLHAYELEVKHPITHEKQNFKAPLIMEFSKLVN